MRLVTLKMMGESNDSDKTLDELKKALAPFLDLNPYSSIGARGVYYVEKPWDDETLILSLPEEGRAEFIEILNAVKLPARFSALWHSDTKDLEVVWTAHKLSAGANEVAARKFSFSFGSKDYVCEFSDSSGRMIAIARNFVPIRGSDTSYRNLVSTSIFLDADKRERERHFDKPRSFWVRGVEWDENTVADLVNHLNFYMSYFDDRTPKIIIHPRREVTTVKPQHRYVDGKFPATIKARTVDPNILHFWNAAHGAEDQAKSFLYYYRLIEYASTAYIDAEARAAVRRLLKQPSVLDDVPTLTEQLVLAIQLSKKEEEQRIIHLLQDTVDRSKLWKEIQNNCNSFNKATVFEGGFTLEPLISQNTQLDQFDLSKFAKHTKDIRNALSHGRDIRTQMVIIPTQKNFDLLQPWVTLMCIAAGEVILFGSIT